MDRQQVVGRIGEETAHRARQLRASWFHIAVLVAAIGFGVLALLARTIWYFQIDLQLTRTVQGASSPWLDA